MATTETIAAAVASARESGALSPSEPEIVTADVVEEPKKADDAVVDDDTDDNADEGGEPEHKPDVQRIPSASDDDEPEKPVEKKSKKADDDKKTDDKKSKAGEKPEKKDEKKVKTDDEGDEIGPERDDKGQVNKIPQPRVKEMVEKREAKLVKSIEESLGFKPGSLNPKNVGDAMKSVVKDFQKLQGAQKFMDETEPLMMGDGEAFIRKLHEHFPDQYQGMVDFLDGKATNPNATERPKGDEPGPDMRVKLPDGSEALTYSPEGLKARDAYRDSVLRADILDETEKRISKRMKPIDDARNKEQTESDLKAKVTQEINDVLSEAHAHWSGFSEHEEEIRAAARELPPEMPLSRAIRVAYDKVVVQGLRTKAEKAREEALAELAKAAEVGSTSSVAAGAGRKRDDKPRGEDGSVLTGTAATVARSVQRAKAAGRL